MHLQSNLGHLETTVRYDAAQVIFSVVSDIYWAFSLLEKKKQIQKEKGTTDAVSQDQVYQVQLVFKSTVCFKINLTSVKSQTPLVY